MDQFLKRHTVAILSSVNPETYEEPIPTSKIEVLPHFKNLYKIVKVSEREKSLT